MIKSTDLEHRDRSANKELTGSKYAQIMLPFDFDTIRTMHAFVNVSY